MAAGGRFGREREPNQHKWTSSRWRVGFRAGVALGASGSGGWSKLTTDSANIVASKGGLNATSEPNVPDRISACLEGLWCRDLAVPARALSFKLKHQQIDFGLKLENKWWEIVAGSL